MYSDIEESKLVELLNKGDKDAQEYFVKIYYSNMFSIAYRYLNNKEDIKDVIQDSFIKAIQKIDQFRGRSSLKTWLTTIVINNCLMKIRAQKRNMEVPAEDHLPRFDNDGFRIEDKTVIRKSPEDLVHNKQNNRYIKQALESLPDHYRAIILLRDIEGYSEKETAERLEITVSNVKSRLHRARLMLKKFLGEYFGE